MKVLKEEVSLISRPLTLRKVKSSMSPRKRKDLTEDIVNNLFSEVFERVTLTVEITLELIR